MAILDQNSSFEGYIGGLDFELINLGGHFKQSGLFIDYRTWNRLKLSKTEIEKILAYLGK